MLKKIDNQKPFELFAQKWAKTLPPSRPCRGDLEIYTELLKQYSKPNQSVLILGATPELRDLCFKYRLKVTIVDINKTMIQAMTTLRKTSSPEKVIISRWQKIPLKNKYNFILGDASLNMLDKKDLSPTLKRVAQLLNDQGYFIQRVVTFNPLKKIKAQKAIKLWRTRKITINDFRHLIEFYSEYRSYNPHTKIDSKRLLLDNILKMYHQGLLNNKEFVKFSLYDDNVKLTVLTLKAWQRPFRQNFEIIDVLKASDFLYCHDMPTVVLKKK